MDEIDKNIINLHADLILLTIVFIVRERWVQRWLGGATGIWWLLGRTCNVN